jgi:perosamine synthetase
MKVEFGRPYVDKKEINAVTEVIKSGWYAHGPKNTEFEKMFAEYIGTKYAISVNSATAALFLSILAMDIKGEVIVPSFSFVASANTIVTAGATPVFVDVYYETGNMLVEKIEELITPKTQAIMCVHYAGQCCLMEPLLKLCKKYKLKLIEDSAECIGGTYKGKIAGSFGDTGCFSFFPTKNITTGEGGMVTTNSDELNAKIRALLAHGLVKDTHARQQTAKPWMRSATYAGYNFRLSSILAAMGVEQMKKLEMMNKKRIVSAQYYNKQLRSIDWVEVPTVAKDCDHVFQTYAIKINNGKRDEVLEYLMKNDIQVSVHFDPAIHDQVFYAKKKYRHGDLSNTESLAKNSISLPIHPGITKKEIKFVVDTIKSFKPSSGNR